MAGLRITRHAERYDYGGPTRYFIYYKRRRQLIGSAAFLLLDLYFVGVFWAYGKEFRG